MAGNPFPRGVLAEGLQMCAEGSKSTWRNACSFLTSQAAGALLLTGCCHLLYFFTLVWIWTQSVKIFSRIQTRRNFTKRALREAMNTDRAWKDQIERLEVVNGPEAEMNGESIHECIHPLIPVCVSVSDSKAKQKVLETPEMVDAIDVKLEQRSSLLQSKEELNSQSMSMIRNLAVDCTKTDKKFTVQLSRWRLFIHTPGGVKMLKLDDAHKVPTIRHASYAAGKLTIEGFNLEGAEIKAATFNKCTTLKNLTKEEVGGLQIWTCVTRLPSNNLREVFVCATKPICIEEHDVIVRSSVTGVQDHNLRIVLRVGIPSTIGLIYMVIMYVKLFSLEGWRFADPAIVWTLPLMAMAVTQILPQSTEDAIEVCIDRIGLAAVSLFIGARSLIFKPHPTLAGRTIPPLLLPPSLPSAKRVDYEEKEESMDHKKKTEKIRRSYRGGKPLNSEKPKRKDSDGETEEEPQCLVYEEYADEFGRISVRKRAPQSEDPKRRLPFKFIHGLKSKVWIQRDHFKFYADTVLVEVLRKFLPEKFNFMGSNKVIVYAAEFFPFRYELKQSLDSIAAEISVNLDQAQADQVKAHLQYFWQFFDTSCHEVSDRYEAMKKEGSVSWDMLWAFFSPDTKVAYRCAITGEEVCATAQTIDYEFYPPDRIPKFIIGLKTWDYNCRTWTSYSIVQRRIAEYPGHCDLASLATHPLEFKTNPLEAENRFLAKGRWFCELSMLAGNRFMQYEGLMYTSRRDGVTKDAVSGRVMIGLASFAKMNPDYPLLTANPPNDHRHGPGGWGSKLEPHTSRNSGFFGTSNTERFEKKRESIDLAGGQLRTNQPELINISEREDRTFAPTIVYGFSFQLKKWGAFNIDGFEDIVFNESAYESLVMDSKLKDTIYSLVHEYKQSDDSRRDTPRERVDPIVGKGEGCILLCYGPPGTGKTFTAESISEKLHAPLWSLSVSELGTTPALLEKQLVRILDVAASWGAVLLLDEADVYLEKRDTGTMDLERNAMTGIFLRNLEYYKGVLFLTTNRVVAFDDAFCSRISMFLYYEKHSEGDRRTVWKNLLKPLKVKDLEAFLETDYASFELNAREIRNVVQVARTLAKTKGEELSGVFLRHSLETLAASLLQLRQVTGEKHTSSFGFAHPPP